MSDEKLFSAFADQLAKAHRKFTFFKEFQGPLDYLKQYRRNLIQEFFDTLKTEAEMRLFVVPVDRTSTLLPNPNSNRLTANTTRGSSGSGEKTEDDDGGAIGESSSMNSFHPGKDPNPNAANDDASSTKSYNPNLANRIVRQAITHANKKPSEAKVGKKASISITSEENRNKVIVQDLNDGDDAGLEEPSSKQHIVAPTDFIPTSHGYMTVEDWNLG